MRIPVEIPVDQPVLAFGRHRWVHANQATAAFVAALLGCLERSAESAEQPVFDNDTSNVASRPGGRTMGVSCQNVVALERPTGRLAKAYAATTPAQRGDHPLSSSPVPAGSDRRARDYTVRAVERVCSILNLLQESIEGVSLPEVAEATDLPKATAFRYLWTLERHRYVERDAEEELFRLGLGFVGMQSRQLEVLRQKARPWLEKLRDDLGETINLGLLDGHEVIYVDIVESHRGVRLAARRGDRDPVHSTALGKAVTSRLPDERVRLMLEQGGMSQRTENTITSVDAFLEELDRVRRTGYSVDDRENEIDGRCVAVPLPGTRLPAAVSFSAPSARFPQRQIKEVGDRLIEAANGIASDAGSQSSDET